jgi:hypothetical protein
MAYLRFGLETDHSHPPHRLHATRAQALTEVAGVTSIPLWRSSPRVLQEAPLLLSDLILPYLSYSHVSPLDLLLRLWFHFSIVQNRVDFTPSVGFRERFSQLLHVVLCTFPRNWPLGFLEIYATNFILIVACPYPLTQHVS